ncbi:hypothetical protein [Pseudomonas sp. L1(2025)]|uniref:hypothetical protein n=1 Tax=Pseudomonas sp. L1(2025) TaxID=3449429 RepID=UPI003F68E7DB
MSIFHVAVALGGLTIWKKVEADKNDRKREEEKVWNRFETSLNHTFETYKEHAKKGEFAQAIRALKQHITLFNERGSVTPEDKKNLDRMLNDLVFNAQTKAIVLGREFKVKEASLQDDPHALSVAHHEYIEALKVVLPQDDAVLRREVQRWEQLYPRISLYT